MIFCGVKYQVLKWGLFLTFFLHQGLNGSPLFEHDVLEAGHKSHAVRVFYVLQAGWHTGIVLRTADVNEDDWPEIVFYRSSTSVDIGWGDEKFYQAEGSPPGLAARAALVPTSSVIHIVPFNVNPLYLYAGETFLKKIEATPEQFSKLCRVISASFERDENGRIMESALKQGSKNFFKAKGKYHILNTCNTWVVSCLQEAGFDVNPAGVITQQHLIRALKELPGGEWIND